MVGLDSFAILVGMFKSSSGYPQTYRTDRQQTGGDQIYTNLESITFLTQQIFFGNSTIIENNLELNVFNIMQIVIVSIVIG